MPHPFWRSIVPQLFGTLTDATSGGLKIKVTRDAAPPGLIFKARYAEAKNTSAESSGVGAVSLRAFRKQSCWFWQPVRRWVVELWKIGPAGAVPCVTYHTVVGRKGSKATEVPHDFLLTFSLHSCSGSRPILFHREKGAPRVPLPCLPPSRILDFKVKIVVHRNPLPHTKIRVIWLAQGK